MLNRLEMHDRCEDNVLHLKSEVTYRKKLQDIGNKINARTIDRDSLPEESVKKLGLLKINLLPKKHPQKEFFIILWFFTTSSS